MTLSFRGSFIGDSIETVLGTEIKKEVIENDRYALAYKETPKLKAGITILKPNKETRGHFHEGIEEVYFFVRGSGKMLITHKREDLDGLSADYFDVNPGDVIMIPDGAFHKVINNTDQELEFVVAFNKEQNERPFPEKMLESKYQHFGNKLSSNEVGQSFSKFEGKQPPNRLKVLEKQRKVLESNYENESKYGTHNGYSKWLLAKDFLTMTNDDFFRMYGFNFVPDNNLLEAAKRHMKLLNSLTISSMSSMRYSAGRRP